MVYHGHVRGQVVILDHDVRLPEGMQVAVMPVQPQPGPDASPEANGLRNGVPVFPAGAQGVVNLAIVNSLRDEVS